MNIKLSQAIVDHINSRFNLNLKTVLSVRLCNVFDELVFKFGEERIYEACDTASWDQKVDWVIARPTSVEDAGHCFRIGDNACLIGSAELLFRKKIRDYQSEKNIVSILELPCDGKYQELAICYTNHPRYLASQKCQIHQLIMQR